MLFGPKPFPRKHNCLLSRLACVERIVPSLFQVQHSPSFVFQKSVNFIGFSVCGNIHTFLGVYISIDLNFLHCDALLPIGNVNVS